MTPEELKTKILSMFVMALACLFMLLGTDWYSRQLLGMKIQEMIDNAVTQAQRNALWIREREAVLRELGLDPDEIHEHDHEQ